MRVVRIEAIDADPGDAIRSYAIAGGADADRFSIVAHTGVLSFREPPNFEAPADVGSTDPPSEARDNEYIVVVRVASGPVSRDRDRGAGFHRAGDRRGPGESGGAGSAALDARARGQPDGGMGRTGGIPGHPSPIMTCNTGKGRAGSSSMCRTRGRTGPPP